MSADSREGLFAVCGSFIGLSTIAISLRFYARRYQKVPLGVDDWTAPFGGVTYIAAAALGIEIAVLKIAGYGTLTPAQEAAIRKPGIQIQTAYDFVVLNTLACVKISALFMYRRIFAVDRHGWFNLTVYATVVVIAMWYITSDFLSLYQCRNNFSAYWGGNFKKECDLNPVWAKELAITDLILDVWVLVLPLPCIFRLHTSTTKKLGIFGVFLLSFVGLGASIARVVFFTQAKGPSQRVTYIQLLEAGMSITVVNLPSIYYLCTSIIPSHVARSLRSIRSIGSMLSNDSRNQSEGGAGGHSVGGSVQSAPIHEKSPWGSKSSSAGIGNETDIEAGRVQYFEEQYYGQPPNQRSTSSVSQHAIHVKNDFEIRREPPNGH